MLTILEDGDEIPNAHADGVLRVNLNGKLLFTWRCIGNAIDEVLKAAENAKAKGIDPAEAALRILGYAAKHGHVPPTKSQQEREGALISVIWLLLNTPTGDLDHPGLAVDYLPLTNVIADVRVDSGGAVFVNFEGRVYPGGASRS